jgi:hypothetical protein
MKIKENAVVGEARKRPTRPTAASVLKNSKPHGARRSSTRTAATRVLSGPEKAAASMLVGALEDLRTQFHGLTKRDDKPLKGERKVVDTKAWANDLSQQLRTAKKSIDRMLEAMDVLPPSVREAARELANVLRDEPREISRWLRTNWGASADIPLPDFDAPFAIMEAMAERLETVAAQSAGRSSGDAIEQLKNLFDKETGGKDLTTRVNVSIETIKFFTETRPDATERNNAAKSLVKELAPLNKLLNDPDAFAQLSTVAKEDPHGTGSDIFSLKRSFESATTGWRNFLKGPARDSVENAAGKLDTLAKLRF